MAFELFTPMKNWTFYKLILIKRLRNFLSIFIDFIFYCLKRSLQFFFFFFTWINNHLKLFSKTESVFTLIIDKICHFIKIILDHFWVWQLISYNMLNISHIDKTCSHLTNFIKINLSLNFQLLECLYNSWFLARYTTQERDPQLLNFIWVIKWI